MKYKVKNCPAFTTGRTDTDWEYFEYCHFTYPHVLCEDCLNCVVKRTIEKCKEMSYKDILSLYEIEIIE